LSKSSKIVATAIETPHVRPHLPEPVFSDKKHHIRIFQGDCLDILASLPEGIVDLIFADPPYFLSNNGITCHAGKMVSANKGEWDRSRGPDANHEFNRAWLAACQRVLKPNGTIWVTGTSHVIEDELAFVRSGAKDAVDQGDGFLRGVLAEAFLRAAG
jgi:tRNA1(Val) A37 N6-methylase TrmN6